MSHFKYKYLFIGLLLVVVASACKKQWDQRNAITDQQLNVNLLQQIQANPNLSTFAGYLAKIGYDKLLSSTKTFTVWAPTNAALQGIDPAIVSDTARLHKFVANHIANQTYLTGNIQGSLRVRNLNGKNLTFTTTTVEDANITLANQYVNNGVLHIIDKALPVKMNISEFVRGLTTVGLLQQAYVLRQDTSFIDTSKATVASIDPKTGKPILVAGTGVVTQNKYFNKTGALANEDSLYTYFVLTDNAYNAERAKVSKYFATVTNSTDTTMNLLSAFNVLKDVVVRGVYTSANLPATLKSVNGVTVPIDKTAIVQTFNASNGIVYVMSSMNFNVAEKITPIIIQGESASFFTRTDQGGKIAIRARKELDGTTVYRDLLISGSGLPASFFAGYKLSNLNTCQYKVIIRAVNDTLFTKVPMNTTNPALNQSISERVMFGQITAAPVVAGNVTPTTAVNFPYTSITPYNYNELTLTNATTGTVTANSTLNMANGTLNVTKYSSIFMYVQGAATTAANTNDVLVDYIKLIPVLQ
ncbi:fasciclin domain-containing protein [Mucilaginibacter boryungensis]|uniref:Fasciclin domain-containing protein n=1 Tax=Mucilaginibacter boryungensis TaxID=768480 RepID=A0ABR9XG54_9SPHI|nr:fasciclin domain-containing protein [Mucilaginibacter boryungensis]MBE9666374.1 fasciclin domain-containing protein [Mucilaginibacter boryungensis]